MDKKTKLKKLCETRWFSRSDALTTFKHAFPVVVDSLEHLRNNRDDKAGMFRAAILRLDFIVCLVVCQHILNCVVQLSYFLQDISCDMLSAIDECRVVILQLEQMRQDDRIWESLFEEAKNIANEHDIEPSCPERVGRQQNRANVPANSVSDYWRRVLYYVLLDHRINELQQRLIVTEPRFQAKWLLPSQATKNQITDAKVAELFTAYRTDIPGDLNFFKTEVDRWVIRWSISAQKPSSLCKTLNMTTKALYPCIWNILTELITMPVATATAERSFSVLRRIKTYLRTSMHQERLSVLGLTHFHREIPINVERVIDTFASRKNRKMSFLY